MTKTRQSLTVTITDWRSPYIPFQAPRRFLMVFSEFLFNLKDDIQVRIHSDADIILGHLMFISCHSHISRPRGLTVPVN